MELNNLIYTQVCTKCFLEENINEPAYFVFRGHSLCEEHIRYWYDNTISDIRKVEIDSADNTGGQKC